MRSYVLCLKSGDLRKRRLPSQTLWDHIRWKPTTPIQSTLSLPSLTHCTSLIVPYSVESWLWVNNNPSRPIRSHLTISSLRKREKREVHRTCSFHNTRVTLSTCSGLGPLETELFLCRGSRAPLNSTKCGAHRYLSASMSGPSVAPSSGPLAMSHRDCNSVSGRLIFLCLEEVSVSRCEGGWSLSWWT